MNWRKSLNPVKDTNFALDKKNIFKAIKGKVRFSEALMNHTTFRVGGPAKFFIEPKDAHDLKLLLRLAKRYKIRLFVIGKGSNILVSDKGVDGLVLRLNAPYFKRLALKKNRLDIGSGALLNRIVIFAKEHGLSGIEFLAGIPGTLGGALMMNAGISRGVEGKKPMAENIGDIAEDIKVMDYDGNIKILNKSEIKFGYRKSSLSRYIILSARIKLVEKNKQEIENRIKKYLGYRKITQDLSRPSAGCIFRNSKGYSAGKLIDLCGLKGRRLGGAAISPKHANFILNLRAAHSRDILRLMDLARKKVNDKFNVGLEPEIKIWQ